jgi:hypothetical protein
MNNYCLLEQLLYLTLGRTPSFEFRHRLDALDIMTVATLNGNEAGELRHKAVSSSGMVAVLLYVNN